MDVIGWTFGLMGFVFGLIAWSQVQALEKRLRELKVLPDGDNGEA